MSPLRFRAVCLLLGAIEFAFLGSCTEEPSSPTAVHEARVLRRGIGADPSTLDPSLAIDNFSFDVIHDLYEGLTTETPMGEVVPGVASDWTIDPSGTIYSLRIRRDARWSNGKSVTAEDFVAAWRRVVDPKTASPVADLLRPIARASEIIAGRLPASTLGVTATRNDLLTVQLEEPAPYFPQLLTHSATFPTYSEKATEAHTPVDWVSNGPYVLADWIPGAKIVLKANPFYWNRQSVRISAVEYIPVEDENSELRQYTAGQLDLTQNIPLGSLSSLENERPKELLIAPYLGVAYYALNVRDPGPLRNSKVRQALAMSIDRRKLRDAFLAFGQAPAYGFVPAGTWNYEAQSWSWEHDPDSTRIELARRLYSESGYSYAKPLKLRLLFNSNTNIKQITLAISSMWKEVLGVDTELIEEEYRVFLDSRKDTKKWDIARLAWAADYNDAANFLETFRSTSSNNDSGFANRDFDLLLDNAAKTADALKRRAILETAEKLMLSQYTVIPVYFYSSRRLVKPYLRGAEPNPLNRLYSRHLYFVEN